MPHAVRVNPITGAPTTKKQFKHRTESEAGGKGSISKAMLKAEWHQQGILASPHYHRLKASIPVVAPRSKRNEAEHEIVDDNEFLYYKDQLHGGYSYWEDHRSSTHHEEGFMRAETDRFGNTTQYSYRRISNRASYLSPWDTTVYRSVVGRSVADENRNFTPSPQPQRPAQAPVVLPRPTQAPSIPAHTVTVLPSPQPRRDLPNVPGATYPPETRPASVSSRVYGSRGNTAPFSYAPFRSFNQPRGSAPKRRGRTLRYVDLYPNERKCVNEKLGGWASFKLLPYSQQISALRTCLRSSRY